MFDWLRKLFQCSSQGYSPDATLDELNAIAGGAAPVLARKSLGTLRILSRTLVLGDPNLGPASLLEIRNLDADVAALFADVWRYPSGMETVVRLFIDLGLEKAAGRPCKIAEIGIDTAKLVVADKESMDKHWTEFGKDRIGIIPTPPGGDSALNVLRKRFHLQTIQANPFRHEVLGPISENVESEILAFLQSIPKWADYPFMYFYVRTNSSFDRVNEMEEAWGFMPIGNDEEPLTFACGTGRGDGLYDVLCRFAGDTPSQVTIDFIGNANNDDE